MQIFLSLLLPLLLLPSCIPRTWRWAPGCPSLRTFPKIIWRVQPLFPWLPPSLGTGSGWAGDAPSEVFPLLRFNFPPFQSEFSPSFPKPHFIPLVSSPSFPAAGRIWEHRRIWWKRCQGWAGLGTLSSAGTSSWINGLQKFLPLTTG